MTWYADLAPCNYFGDRFADRLKTIGWLESERAFEMGEVSEEFFEKLCHLLINPWSPVMTMGSHPCGFCRFTGGGISQYKNYSISGLSSSFLFVPGDGFVYIAPISIAHYIDAHGYCPPASFQEAVLACPEMRSVAYLESILKNGLREFVRR